MCESCENKVLSYNKDRLPRSIFNAYHQKHRVERLGENNKSRKKSSIFKNVTVSILALILITNIPWTFAQSDSGKRRKNQTHETYFNEFFVTFSARYVRVTGILDKSNIFLTIR